MNNTSKNYGGGMFLKEAWVLYMNNCRFYNNSVQGMGGGAMIDDVTHIYLFNS